MALEVKNLNVDSDEEDAYIERYTSFGWNLKSCQRVYSKDSHLENYGAGSMVVTETVDYTKLIFERDTSMPHYAKLVSLENEYDEQADLLPDYSYDYSSKISLADWAHKERPQLIKKPTFWSGCLLSLLIGGISFLGGTLLGFIIMLVVCLIGSTPWSMLALAPVWGIMLAVIGFVAGGLIIRFAQFGMYAARNRSALKKAIADPESKYRAELEALYNAAIASVKEIEDIQLRMAQLRLQAALLME